ncbi:MAG: hypothetical protein ACRYHA_21495 [Janthinobacterium lividum]
MNKFDIEKGKGLKLTNSLKAGSASVRFGQEAAQPKLDKREQRRLDQEKGLVPFACKLDAELVRQLQERAAAHEGGMSAALAELLATAGLQSRTSAAE